MSEEAATELKMIRRALKWQTGAVTGLIMLGFTVGVWTSTLKGDIADLKKEDAQINVAVNELRNIAATNRGFIHALEISGATQKADISFIKESVIKIEKHILKDPP